MLKRMARMPAHILIKQMVAISYTKNAVKFIVLLSMLACSFQRLVATVPFEFPDLEPNVFDKLFGYFRYS